MIQGHYAPASKLVPVDSWVLSEVDANFDVMLTFAQGFGQSRIAFICLVGDSCLDGYLVPNWIIA